MALKAGSRSALIVVVSRLAVSAVVLASGFSAVSDDDYARIVIAQSFAHAPSLDPSGTSWLPLPFWIVGGAMAAFGRSVAVARVVALVLGVLAALAVYVAARWLDVPTPRAALGAVVACLVPYNAVLGVAAVPDGPTAALIVLGAAAAASAATAPRLLGGIALGAACLSRYEAWPVAAGFAAFGAWDALRRRSLVPALASLIAVVPSLWWMAHGLAAHGDALFFVKRVAAYREALGGPGRSVATRLVSFPLAALRCEPELAGVALVAMIGGRTLLGRYGRLGALMIALIAFLVAGDLRDGAPTHHPERAVLAVWLCAAIVVGDILPQLVTRRRLPALAAAGAAFALGAVLVRPWFAKRDSYIDRSREVAAGALARSVVPATERVLVDTPDYGFYAVIAGFAQPERAAPVSDHDPRHAPPADAFASPAALEARARAAGARWVVTSGAHAAVALGAGRARAQRDGYALIELAP